MTFTPPCCGVLGPAKLGFERMVVAQKVTSAPKGLEVIRCMMCQAVVDAVDMHTKVYFNLLSQQTQTLKKNDAGSA